MKIALDAMGGDFGPSYVVPGAVMALREYRHIEKLFLVGDPAKIEAELKKHRCNDKRVEIYPARSEEHTSELQSPCNLVCRLLLEKKKQSRQPVPLHRFPALARATARASLAPRVPVAALFPQPLHRVRARAYLRTLATASCHARLT